MDYLTDELLLRFMWFAVRDWKGRLSARVAVQKRG